MNNVYDEGNFLMVEEFDDAMWECFAGAESWPNGAKPISITGKIKINNPEAIVDFTMIADKNGFEVIFDHPVFPNQCAYSYYMETKNRLFAECFMLGLVNVFSGKHFITTDLLVSMGFVYESC